MSILFNFERMSLLFLQFILLLIPYFIYIIAAMIIFKPAKTRLIYWIFQIFFTIIFLSLLCLFLFSIYRCESITATLSFLSRSFNNKFIIAAFILNSLIIFFYAIIRKKNGIINIYPKKLPIYFLLSLFIFFFALSAALGFSRMYGIIPIEQFIFHLSFKIRGANYSMVNQFVIKPLLESVLMLLFSIYILSAGLNINKYYIQFPFSKFKKGVVFITALLPVAGVILVSIIVELPQYIVSLYKNPSTFYEDNYIHPEYVNFSFPDKKRNLIVIFVESLETGFLTIENEGAFIDDLIPEVAVLIKNNISYSGKDTGIGGITQLYGTEWTVAGITAYYLGVPLAVNFLNQARWNSYGILGDEFLPGAYGISNILYAQGYKNYFILGSDIEFGGRDKLFKTHKNTIIYDYNYFHDNSFIPAGYKVWWGIEDRKIYQYAKTKITEIARQENPFFITLLTADTHPVGGFLDEHSEIIYDSQFKNVLHDMSRQLSDFIEWLYQQPFFENTTIVILGDHLYQDSSFFPQNFQIQKLSSKYEDSYFLGNNEENYNRFAINIFINSLLPGNDNINRSLSHFDVLPLLVESVGATFDAKGLALGRSLHTQDGEETLVEKYGVTFMNEQLRRTSKLYNQLWSTSN